MATGGFLSQLSTWTNGAIPFYVVGVATLIISFDSLFGLKDVVVEQEIKRSMSMREEDRTSVVLEKKNPCIKAARIFKMIGKELISDARFFVALSVMATLKLCFITFSFTNPYLQYVYNLKCENITDTIKKEKCKTAGRNESKTT